MLFRSPTDVTTNTGLAGANTVPLATSPTAINQLVEEFYNVISYGYYGLDDGCPGASSGPMACGGAKSLNTPDITGWANATMLSIYDQMAFPQDSPATIYPTDKTTRVDSGY